MNMQCGFNGCPLRLLFCSKSQKTNVDTKDGPNTINAGWWYTYPSEKYEFVSWDDDIPNIWKTNITMENEKMTMENVPTRRSR